MQEFCEVQNTDPAQHQRWLDKHGFKPGADGTFPVADFEGKIPVTTDTLLDNIRANVSAGDYTSLYEGAYDERTFVMVCGGPSLERHLEEIRAKSLDREKYLIVCSNMTGGYLLEHGITPHVHFILDPQEKKKYDVAPSKTSTETQYWINVACHQAVFAALKEQGITPYAFLADFDVEGKAVQAVKDSIQPGKDGMMAIQGGTMAGLRAMNLADALGFRKMEYYGFDATVAVADGRARPYAYEKKRGEAIIEIQCDRCQEKFDTTLIFQKQVNEFLLWRGHMPWLEVEIIGGGLIAHYKAHVEALEKKDRSAKRFTEEYAAIQRELHDEGSYGVSGQHYIPTIFHGISQLAKRHGSVSVLDYGSAGGKTMKLVRNQLWIPPTVVDTCYDPFVEEFAAEPAPADFVICTDVLEHVEPECTEAVLDHIAALTKCMAFFTICLVPATKTLSDGRNAHINLRDSEYWLKQIKRRFVTSEAKVFKDDVLMVIAQSIDGVRETLRQQKKALAH
jgi:uncharacterized Rossmann fold enzyme